MFKKIVSLMLVVCMLFTLGVAVSAEGEQVIEVTATAIEDGAFCVDISIKNNILTTYEGSAPTNDDIKGLSAYQVDLTYDSDIFEVYEPYVETAYDGDPTVNGTKAQWSTTYGLRLTEGTGKNRTYNYYKDATLLRYEIDIKSDIPEEKLGTTERISIDSAFSKFANIDGSIINIEPAFVDVVIPDTREPIAGLVATTVEGKVYTGEAYKAEELITINTVADDVVVYEPAEITNAGEYEITATVSRKGFKKTEVKGTAKITKKDIVVTMGDASMTYGDAELPAFTHDAPAGVEITPTVAANPDAGEVAITATANDTTGNYNVTVTPGTLTVKKKAITAKVKDATKVYGEEDPAFEADATGLVGEDTLTYTYNRAEGENVGTYAINATVADANYDVTVVPGTLTVNPKAATIKVQNEFQVLGDGKLATFKTPVVEGLVGEDTIEGIVVDFAAGTPWADVEGDYTLTATYTANPNYTITVVDGVYAIKTAIPVVVTFGENKKTYGDADDAEILATGDLDKVTITRVKGLENAAAGIYEDAYEITLIEEKDEYGVPYAVVDTNNQFVVEPKAATITIANAEKKVEDADPEFTFTAEGFLEADKPAEITFTRLEGETAGEYAITTDYADPNYAITVNDGTLTISKYKVKVTAPTVTVFVGRTAPELVATIENENQEELTATVSVYEEDGVTTVTEVDTSSAKKYVTKAVIEGLDTDKYDFEYVDGTITVRESGGRPSGTGIIKPATGVGGGSGSTTKPEDKDDTAKPAASANIAIKEDAKDVNFAVADAENKFNPDVNASRNDVVAAISAIFDVTDVKNAPAFTDTEDEAIKALAAAGVINGYEDGSFQGEKDITRAEFVKLVAAALKLEAIEGAEANFSDIDGHWASEWIKTFVAKGYLVGYPDGTFRPEAKISRAEMVVVITRVTGAVAGDAAVEFADVDASHWAYDYIMKAAK